MGDLFFVIKTFFLTVIAVLILQVKIGDFTLEERSMNWVRSSVFVGHLQEVADGSVVLLDRGIDKVKAMITSKATEEVQEIEPLPRSSVFNLERSKEYLQEQAAIAKKVVSEAVTNTVDAVQDSVETAAEEVAEEQLMEAMETESTEE